MTPNKSTHKRPGPRPRIKRTDGPTPTQSKIIAVAEAHPTLSTPQIGAIVGCDHSHVVRTLAKYGVDQGQLEAFQSKRGDIFAWIQHRLLSSITDEDIKKTPLGSRVLAAAQLYDKERLEKGESTGNVAVMVGFIQQIQGKV